MRERSARPRSERHIARVVFRTRVSMFLESALRAAWPVAAAIAAIWAAIAFGVLGNADRLWTLAFLGLALALVLWLLIRGIRSFRWPTAQAAAARLDSTLPGRPLAALSDRPAFGTADPAVNSVWAAHLARMAERARKARPLPADLRLAATDPWAIRLAVLVFFISALIFARGDSLSEVRQTLAAQGPASAIATGPSYEGWAEPPQYTGRPTLYLPEISGGAPVSLPKGTKITLRAYGEPEAFALTETVSGPAGSGSGSGFAAAAEGISLAEFDLSGSGTVELLRDGGRIGAWTFEMEADAPPTIALPLPVERAPGGATRITYEASDDYGVTGVRATIRLDLDAVDRRYGLKPAPDARPDLAFDLPLPMSGAAREMAETVDEDFSRHPWAGLPVEMSLRAEDALGQTGTAGGIRFDLPGRSFFDPAAAALAEQRRDLLWSVENGPRVRQVLRAITWQPEPLFDRAGAYLITRTVIRRLDTAIETGRVADVRDDLADALWRAALLLEEGSLGDAAERLAKAKERLQEALRGDATDFEIAELMDELREATRDYMEQMAREALESGEAETAEAPPEGQTMSQDQLQQLMDRIQELSEQGRRAEAEALLEMLQQMLENMEMRFAQGQGQGSQGEQGQQSMQGLSDALREQQGLADESFRQLQREFGQGGQQGRGRDGQRPGQEPGPSQEGTLAERQDALRGLLDELQRNLPGDAGEGTRGALDEAERNMGSARDALREGDTAGALDEQANAIENFREGMRNLSEDIRQAEGGQGGQETGGNAAQAESRTDPLGRPLNSQGGVSTNSNMLRDGMGAAARARSILDEIRRRSGDLSRPQIELDYLKRLLDRF